MTKVLMGNPFIPDEILEEAALLLGIQNSTWYFIGSTQCLATDLDGQDEAKLEIDLWAYKDHLDNVAETDRPMTHYSDISVHGMKLSVWVEDYISLTVHTIKELSNV